MEATYVASQYNGSKYYNLYSVPRTATANRVDVVDQGKTHFIELVQLVYP